MDRNTYSSFNIHNCPTKKNLKCLSTVQWVTNINTSIQWVKYSAATKAKYRYTQHIFIPDAVLLSGRSETSKTLCHIIAFVWHSGRGDITDKNRPVVSRASTWRKRLTSRSLGNTFDGMYDWGFLFHDCKHLSKFAELFSPQKMICFSVCLN